MILAELAVGISCHHVCQMAIKSDYVWLCMQAVTEASFIVRGCCTSRPCSWPSRGSHGSHHGRHARWAAPHCWPGCSASHQSCKIVQSPAKCVAMHLAALLACNDLPLHLHLQMIAFCSKCTHVMPTALTFWLGAHSPVSHGIIYFVYHRLSESGDDWTLTSWAVIVLCIKGC